MIRVFIVRTARITAAILIFLSVGATSISTIIPRNNSMLGRNYRGKTDVAGKAFRDEIVEGALRQGMGWVDYVYTSPVQSGL